MEIRTVTISSKRQITIPKSFSDFSEGEQALIMGDKNKLIIKPMRKVNETALLSEKALEECWNSQEDEEAFAYLQK